MAVNRFLNIRRPLSVQILVTKFCDMTCNMCFTYPIDSKEKFKNTIEPSFKELERLMEEHRAETKTELEGLKII